MKKQIAILGSTGSIGTQVIEVITRHSDLFEIYALTAYNQVDLLIEQAIRLQPEVVVIGNEQHYKILKSALAHLPIKVYAGSEAIAQVVQAEPIHMVVTAMVGYAGLLPTIKAIEAGKAIALANKETLVVAGELINKLALENKVSIIPVDSEHSAIFQCLAGELHNKINRIILTASGGPFRQFTAAQLQSVTKQQALCHPNWSMGAKITIDSASLMNKGFEVIEAKWLFDLKPAQIEVMVHPQSIVHSMVEFEDGAIKAQLGTPDMKIPISYALSYPYRLSNNIDPKLSLKQLSTLTFEEPKTALFPNLGFAYEAMRKGGNMSCVLNAANEVAVAAFLAEKIGFTAMSHLIEKTLQKATYVQVPTYADYVATDAEARAMAQAII